MFPNKAALIAGAVFLLVNLSRADTIYFKNGMYMVVRKTEDKGTQIDYWVGSTKYTVGKNLVLRIEVGNGPAATTRSAPTNGALPTDLTHRDAPTSSATQHEKLQLPLLKGPKQDDAYWTALRNRIMVGDAIDDMRLAEIEIQHDAKFTGDVYYLAGVMEMQRGNSEKASGYFEHAIRARPDEVQFLEWQGIALAAQGRYADAATDLERATQLRPDSADLLRLLGLARYDADRTSDAVAAWKHAQEISPDASTERFLHKAERELAVEERSRRKESRHFTLHYQGDRTSSELQQQLLATMEEHYQDLARQFSYEPTENIIVILYTQKEFVDITEAPAWAGALNDGKLRIPIGGVSSMNPELARVLKHELTHSFLQSLASGHCPAWLNEGLAQMMEPRSSSMFAQRLALLFQAKKEIPFLMLEHSFTGFSDLQAQVAYAESLSAVEYFRDRYGMGEMLRMLQNIGAGTKTEEALERSTGQDYSAFEHRVGEYLAKTAGQ